MLKFFRQQMILQFDWLKIFYTLCFRINITGRKTLKNNYLLWELQLLVPHCVRRNQGGSLFCQWLYSALHWHLMPLVPQVNRIAMVLLWEPFNTWAWQQWNESFVSCLENLKDGIPLQIQSCENPSTETQRWSSLGEKKHCCSFCVYMPVHQVHFTNEKVWWTVVCPQKEACNKDVVGNGGCIDLLQKLWEVTNPRPITEEIAHVPDHSFKSSLEAQRQR